MTSVAIVTAPNMRYVNTGMTTVELAAKAFLRQTIPHADLRFFSLVPPNPAGTTKWMYMDLGYVHPSSQAIEAQFDHTPIVGHLDELFDHDLIIYWGDFLQAQHYIVSEGAGRLQAMYGMQRPEALGLAYKALLQAGMPEDIKRKTLIFGSSLLYNTAEDYSSGPYAEYLATLLRESRCALMRDPISANRVAHVRGDYAQSHLGIDPAFLLRDGDLSVLPVSKWSGSLEKNRSIGLFFGTRTQPPQRLIEFCLALAKRAGTSLEWLPWFPYHDKLKSSRSYLTREGRQAIRRLRQIERLMPRGPEYTVGDLLAALPNYQLVITDTYHLCINAWRAGTPAICFGSEGNSTSHVVKDFKKRILYEMYDASDFYLDVSCLASIQAAQQTLKRLHAALENHSQVQVIRDRIGAHSSAVASRLKEMLEQISGCRSHPPTAGMEEQAAAGIGSMTETTSTRGLRAV